MESKSFGLSLLQCYSDDDEKSTSGNDDEIKSNENNFLQQNPTITDAQGSSIIKYDDEGVKSMVVDFSSVSDSQSPALPDTTQRSALQFPLVYRDSCRNNDSESDSSSDESCITAPIEVDLDASIEEDENIAVANNKGYGANNCKSIILEDLGIIDLAPLEDLKISVPEEECIPIGVVHNIIDPLVIVSAKKGCPDIDLDSALFLDHGKTFLGQVFDVFGQVSEPMYMLRFNSLQHIVEQGIEVGMEVYFAPRTRHTAFVFVDALFKQKGSDASWENDQEPPEGCVDYSDDEQERRAKAAHRLKKNPSLHNTAPGGCQVFDSHDEKLYMAYSKLNPDSDYGFWVWL
ncbi:H/ACA ribonucleoprotein complex non-core subunit NAF1-like [Daphnia carinata]|uniref:H/ACA ribonucleoprotein complex non-core subunit NAF1-like n=1 Tax=Daphnia carinata TaxID=120202 RepID=UPI0028689CBC|nr:H/ACA ribonucleoprotein complex non-core subunit NAF1-like [Daphnia carinata]